VIEQKFQITQDDFGDLNATFIKPYRAAFRVEMLKWMQMMADTAKANAARKFRDPKHLHQSITASSAWLGAGTMVWLRGELGTIVKYARCVEEGTKTPITPRTARVLRFKYNSGVGSYTKLKRGQFIFARSVKGQVAKPFLGPAFEDYKNNAITGFMNLLARVWGEGRRQV